MAGASKSEIKDRTHAAVASNRMATPQPGTIALAFMMSKRGVDVDGNPLRHPHVMLFLAHTDGAEWGAGLHGSPIIAEQGAPEEFNTTFDVFVPFWADGTLPKSMGPH